MPPPAKAIPLAVSYALAAMGTAKARLRGTDEQLSLASLRLMRAEAPVDCSKARRELGWEPRPVEDSIREAARFWVGLRECQAQEQAGRLNDARQAVQAFGGLRGRTNLGERDGETARRPVRSAADDAGDVLRQGAGCRPREADPRRPVGQRHRRPHRLRLVEDDDHGAQLSVRSPPDPRTSTSGRASSWQCIPRRSCCTWAAVSTAGTTDSTRGRVSSGTTSTIPMSPNCARSCTRRASTATSSRHP